jgi:diguanylate cyclase (GGDEF)-like protein/PAS domain S-box-containing protein
MHDDSVTSSLERVLESIGDACIVLDGHGRIVAANRYAEFLYDRQDLVGLELADLCADAESIGVMVSELPAKGAAARSFRTCQLRSDGSRFVGHFSASRCCEPDDRFIMLVVRDCPEAMALCGTDLELQSHLLKAAVDCIYAYTLDGLLIYANDAALERWGESLEGMVARGPFGWVPTANRGRAAERTAQIMSEGELRFETNGVSREGAPMLVEVHSRLLETEHGPVIVADVRDISDRVETEEMVRYLAYHDTLTGLSNRVALDSEIVHSIQASDRHGDILGVVYLDLDDFKPVNDTYGHSLGDHVLREVADRIAGTVRETDTVARVGGDEFVVLLPRLHGADDLPAIGRKLVECIAEPIMVNGLKLRVNASVGLALHRQGEDAETLLTRADLAMYDSRVRRLPGWELWSEGHR